MPISRSKRERLFKFFSRLNNINLRNFVTVLPLIHEQPRSRAHWLFSFTEHSNDDTINNATMPDDWKLVKTNIKVALWPVHWPPSENLLILHGYQQMPANKNFKGVSSSCHFRRNYGEKQWEIHPHNFPIYDIFSELLWGFMTLLWPL